LDEPLAALDRKLRDAMQFELRRIQRQLGIAFLLVTHDQEEAMGLADRVAVMAAGRILQVGPPSEVYDRPANRFVADFLGVANLFAARIVACGDGWVQVACAELGGALRLAGQGAVGDCWLTIRPERLVLHPFRPDAAEQALPAEVENVVFRGAQRHCELRLASGRLVRASQANADGWAARPGEPAWIACRAADLRLLPP
jgi:ABC-type Fe3+/spermidine/putrescine transport system ATPase subunit